MNDFDAMVGQMLLSPTMITAAAQQGADQATKAANSTQSQPQVSTPYVTDPVAAAAAAGMQSAAQTASASAPPKTDWGAAAGRAAGTLASAFQQPQVKSLAPMGTPAPKTSSGTSVVWIVLGLAGIGLLGTATYLIVRKK